MTAITSDNVWAMQQRALLRLHLVVIGETHQILGDFNDHAARILSDSASEGGVIDGLALNKAKPDIERAWANAFTTWRGMVETAREESASIPFGSLAVLHRDTLLSVLVESKASLDYVFNPQLKAVIDAANRRVYADGLNWSQRIWNLDQTSLAGIRSVLLEGVANGASAWDIAKQLESFLGFGRNCPRWTRTRLYGLTKRDIAGGNRAGLISGDDCRAQGVAYNALRLARNEVSIAHHMATDTMLARAPWVTHEQIHLSPAHPETDICDDVILNADDANGTYPKGTITLPLHPQCLCWKSAVLQPPDQFAARLNDWTRGGAWAEMDAYQSLIGGDVRADLMIASAARALARWATEDGKALIKAIYPG